jgi:hypothetical protein
VGASRRRWVHVHIVVQEVLFEQLACGQKGVRIAPLASELERMFGHLCRRDARVDLHVRRDDDVVLALDALDERRKLWGAAEAREVRIGRNGQIRLEGYVVLSSTSVHH